MYMLVMLYVLFVAVTTLVIGPALVNFILFHLTHHVVTWAWAFVLYAVSAGFALPAAIIVKILILVGIIS